MLNFRRASSKAFSVGSDNAKSFFRYRGYLESCLLDEDSGDSFHDIAGIFARHTALTTAAADLEEQHTACSEARRRERRAHISRDEAAQMLVRLLASHLHADL